MVAEEVAPRMLYPPEALYTLTPRQVEIARLQHAGLSNKAIGDELGTSYRTVEQHIMLLHNRLDFLNLERDRVNIRNLLSLWWERIGVHFYHFGTMTLAEYTEAHEQFLEHAGKPIEEARVIPISGNRCPGHLLCGGHRVYCASISLACNGQSAGLS